MRCYQCGGKYSVNQENLELTDEYIGTFNVEGAEYFECDKCGDYLFPPETAEKIDTARRLELEKLLQSMPIKDFVTGAEAARILGISRQALHKHRRIRRGFIFQTRFDEKIIYLRKSVELFKETGDGRFKLVVPEREVPYTSEQKNTLIAVHWSTVDYRQSNRNNFGLIARTWAGGDNNYAR
jgi:hypothetical protein